MPKVSVLMVSAGVVIGLYSVPSGAYAQPYEGPPAATDELPPDEGVGEDTDQNDPDGVEIPPEEGVGPPIEAPADEGPGVEMPPDEDADQLPDPDQE